jgi:hypothetical protein
MSKHKCDILDDLDKSYDTLPKWIQLVIFICACTVLGVVIHVFIRDCIL